MSHTWLVRATFLLPHSTCVAVLLNRARSQKGKKIKVEVRDYAFLPGPLSLSLWEEMDPRSSYYGG